MIIWIEKETDEDGNTRFYWRDEPFYETYDEDEAANFDFILREIWRDGFKLGKEEVKLTGNEEPF